MKYANHGSYKEKIRRKLLASGEQGISQFNLHQQTRTKIFASVDDMNEVLEEWETKGWVQRFIVKNYGSNRRTTMWRATTLLRDDFGPRIKEDTTDLDLPLDASQP